MNGFGLPVALKDPHGKDLLRSARHRNLAATLRSYRVPKCLELQFGAFIAFLRRGSSAGE